MNSLRDNDLDAHEESHGAEHEISLGTATILGIFFALALVCAGFFGFGYSLGRKSSPAPAIAAAPPAEKSGTLFSAFKPAAGSPANHPDSQPAEPPPDAPSPAPPVAQSAPTIPAAAARNGATPADAIIVGDKLAGDRPLAVRPATPQPAPANLQPATTPTGAFMVQIAAVSTQDIADIEVTALKKYGFDVVVRHEPQDQLLHIQVGPYATRKDAEAMRQTILAHGFNAIVK